MAGGTTQAMAAPAVRPERYDTTQRTVWGFFMRCRIRDRGFSPRSGKNGPTWFLTPCQIRSPIGAGLQPRRTRRPQVSRLRSGDAVPSVTPTTRPSDPATTSKNAGRITRSARHGPHDPGDRCVSVGHYVNSSNDPARRSRRPPSAARSVRDRPARGLQG